MSSFAPEVRLARSRNSSVDWNLDTREFIIKLGGQEIRVNPETFAMLAELVSQAKGELKEMNLAQAVEPHPLEKVEIGMEEMLDSMNLRWIDTGLK